MIEYFCKPAATISETAGLNQLKIAERCIQNLHLTSLAFGRFRLKGLNPGVESGTNKERISFKFPFQEILDE